jgi:hypothetical protein
MTPAGSCSACIRGAESRKRTSVSWPTCCARTRTVTSWRNGQCPCRFSPAASGPSRRAADPVRGRRRLALQPTRPPASPAGAQNAYIDAAHWVHARVEDRIRTGKDCGIGHFPSPALAINSTWLTASLIAATFAGLAGAIVYRPSVTSSPWRVGPCT